MAVTLDKFKKAFSTNVTEDQYKGRRGATIAAIRETEEFVKVLGATDRAKEHTLLLARLYVQVDDADRLAVKSRDKAYAALDTARNNASLLHGDAWSDAKQAFGTQKKKAEEAQKTLEKSPHAKHLSKEIEKARGDIAIAQRQADANHFGEALKTVAAVIADCTTVRVKAGLKHGDAPNKSDFEELAKLPGAKGANRLDDLISELPEKTPAKVLKVAFEVRFGIKIDSYKDQKDKDDAVWDKDKKKWTKVGVAPKEWKRIKDSKPNKNLQEMYKLFTKVPESHVKDNPSLKKINHFRKDAHGAAYWGLTQSIYMNVSRDKGTGAKDQSVELATGITGSGTVMFPEPPKRDPVCKPINTNVKTPYFDWATLHEVGHAVDDKTGYMDANGKETKHGEWKEHGGAKSIAKIAAAAFSCDQAYIEKKLNGKDVKDEDVPAALKKDDPGKDLKKRVDKWCKDVISMNVWWDGAKCKRIAEAIGDGRVYQKAYDTTWNSYKLEARAQGLHGYQFRAPGEWFAELYAAYYSEKLQDAHPFVAELKKLEQPS